MADGGPARHGRPGPLWRKVARRPVAVTVLLASLVLAAAAGAGLLLRSSRPGHPAIPLPAAATRLVPLGLPAPLPRPAATARCRCRSRCGSRPSACGPG